MKNIFFRNCEFIKTEAPYFVEKLGYTYRGYEGSEANLIFGGLVWIQSSDDRRPELIFTMALRKQGETLKCIYERIINPEAVQVLPISGVRK